MIPIKTVAKCLPQPQTIVKRVEPFAGRGERIIFPFILRITFFLNAETFKNKKNYCDPKNTRA